MKLKEGELEVTIHIKDNKIEKCRTCNWQGLSVWKKPVGLDKMPRQQVVFPFNTINGWMELNVELRYI